MGFDIDSTLAELRTLRDQIESTPEGPERERLEARREELHTRARLAGDASRPLPTLRAELEAVEKQLDAMDQGLIRPAMNESYKLITDPSAYRRRINESITANEAQRRDDLEQRRQELRDAIAINQAD